MKEKKRCGSISGKANKIRARGGGRKRELGGDEGRKHQNEIKKSLFRTRKRGRNLLSLSPSLCPLKIIFFLSRIEK